MTDVDVCIVGYGPVGQALAALLGARGWRVAVYERWQEPYPLPRAGHLDHEVMCVLQHLGIADEFEALAIPAASYDWLDSERELLFRIDWSRPTTTSWKSDYIFYQPDLERLLSRAAESSPSVTVHRGWQADGLEVGRDLSTVHFCGVRQSGSGWMPNGERVAVRARFVIGADGANSFVRSAAGLEWDDLGYSQTMSVVDVAFDEPDIEIDMPSSGQLCDPRRPITLFRWLARAHARWEFLLLPGEDPAELVSERRCWELLDEWAVTPSMSTIVRRTLYTFRSLIVRRFRRDSVLVVGDAAHLMPPFLGQGLCSGIRDAANLAWKLDTVLRDPSAEALLDSVADERAVHVRTLTLAAIGLAGILCETDPGRARARDEAIRAGGAPVAAEMPGLTTGVLADRPDAVAGSFWTQGQVVFEGRIRRFADVFPAGWMLLCADRRIADRARAELNGASNPLDIQVASFSKANVDAPHAFVDFDGTYERWFRRTSTCAILVRPDLYCYGSASTPADVAGVLHRASAAVSGYGVVP